MQLRAGDDAVFLSNLEGRFSALDFRNVISVSALTQQIRGTINLINCADLELLPEGFCVEEDLVLKDSRVLSSVPLGLNVGRDLMLVGCESLALCPERVRIGGSIFIKECTNVSLLPGALNVRNMIFDHCGMLGLQEGFSVVGSLFFIGCSDLNSLPAGLSVKEKLTVKNCGSLVEFPENIHVGGDLSIESCDSFAFLSGGLFVEGDFVCVNGEIPADSERLYRRSGSGFSHDPSSLRKSLGLRILGRCTFLNSKINFFPDGGVYVGESLDLRDCPDLVALSPKIEAFEDFFISNCPRITTLAAERCFVGRNLIIENCPSLQRIEKIHVEGNLYLIDCPALTSLSHAYIGGNLIVLDCGSLRRPFEEVDIGGEESIDS